MADFPHSSEVTVNAPAIQALERAAAIAGGNDSIASLLNVTTGAVGQWVQGLVAIPENTMQRIVEFNRSHAVRENAPHFQGTTGFSAPLYSTIPKEGNMHHHMKKLFVSIRKGGVGKSTVTGQLATYAHSLGLKVLVIDFDDQGGNTTNFLMRGGVAKPLSRTISEVLFGKFSQEEVPNFAFVAADMRLTQDLVEKARTDFDQDGQTIELATFCHQNFAHFLDVMTPHFDLCIMDGPPAQDIRVTMALALSDFVISPIQLAQESIEGMRDTLSSSRGVLRIKGTVNPALDFLGFLPNQVKSTPKQKEALAELGKTHGQYFLRDDEDRLMLIPERESIRAAQGAGVSLQALATTNASARETWPRLRKVMSRILTLMQMDPLINHLAHLESAVKAQTQSAAKLASLYKAHQLDDVEQINELDAIPSGVKNNEQRDGSAASSDGEVNHD